MKTLLKSYKLSFLDYLTEIRGYSELTVKTYDEAIEEAFLYVRQEEGIINLNPYRMHIASLKSKTIAKKLSAIRSFVKFMQDRGEKITLKGDAPIKVAKTLPKPVAYEHIKEALEKANQEEALIVICLYTLGLRISELANLKLSDINPEWVRVMGKGKKQRELPLLDVTRQKIEGYVADCTPRVYLFEKNGAKLSENSLRYKLTSLFKKIGLHVTPHMLRHSYATHLLNNSARIADVSELLGHASMATTQIYTKLSSQLKMQNYKSAHPLAQGEK